MFLWLARKILGRLASRQARRWAAEFDAATERPREVQDALLRRIIETHRDTQFGQDHAFHEVGNYADFRRRLGVNRYEYFQSYINQMKRGRFDALVNAPTVHMFALTSGTTASRKFIPVTPQYLADYRRGWTIWGIRAIEQYPKIKFQGILQLVSDWDEFRTEAGIPCGSVSGLTAQMQKRVVRWLYVMPAITGKIKDSSAKQYLALRLSLARSLGMITSANPSTLVNLARMCDHEKESLIRDIHDGTLSDRFPIPGEVHRDLHRAIHRANPQRAKELDDIVRRTGTLYPKDCWPNLQLLGNWTGGSVGSYLRFYAKYFGDIPIRDLGLIASEGRLTIPIEDTTTSGVLDVTSHFFEFVPQDEIDSPNPTSFRADEVEVGKEYFIIPTTAFGLYRYNIYDLVRVTGFYHRTPLIEFLNKGAHFANLTGEKLSEFQVVRAMQEALREQNATVAAYSLAPCWDDEMPYYGLFVERGELGGLERVRRLSASIDRHLRALNVEYDSKRASQRLGGVRAMMLPTGAWSDWDQQRLQRSGGTAEQYKHPCLIPDADFRRQIPVEQEVALET
jgi:hypothetical protein